MTDYPCANLAQSGGDGKTDDVRTYFSRFGFIVRTDTENRRGVSNQYVNVTTVGVRTIAGASAFEGLICGTFYAIIVGENLAGASAFGS